MAFEVRQFEFEGEEGNFLWKFNLGNINTSQLDFYSQEASNRSLLHLAQDFTAQIEQTLEKKNKSGEYRERVIRKLSEKTAKSLQVSVSGLAHDLGEREQDLGAYFTKAALDEEVRSRISGKCKKWVIATWVTILGTPFFIAVIIIKKRLIQLSLSPGYFHNATELYMRSYLKDGKKISPDFQILNELYVIALAGKDEPPPMRDLSSHDSFILVDINLTIEDKYISESFLWDQDNISSIRMDTFVTHFLNDILAENSIVLERDAFKTIERETRVQLRTQILYKTLLKKHASILLNFSTMDIPAQVKEYLIAIDLKLSNEDVLIYEDYFEWDILNEANDVEKFVEQLMIDTELPQRYYSEICYKIRTDINRELEWKFNLLVKTFRAIHKDRQSPKLNTQTISVLRKNITHTMDVTLPCQDNNYQLNSNIYFNNSDLFSLLSRNMDILPEDFQEILMCKDSKNNEKEASRLEPAQANEILRKEGESIESNPYLSSLGSSYSLHGIWRKHLAK